MERLVNIVATDNYNRDYVADVMWKADVPVSLAEKLVEILNAHYGPNSETYFTIFEKDQRLSRGMADLV